MKRAWLIAAIVLLTATLATGATFALFTAATDTTQSTITAGTLCLTSKRDNSDPVPGPMFYVTAAQGATPSGTPGRRPTGLWVPGDTHRSTLILDNPSSCSTMDGWLTDVGATLQSGDPTLADKLWVEVRTDLTSDDTVVANGWLSEFLTEGITMAYQNGNKVPIVLDSTTFLHFTVSMPLDTNNDYEGLNLVVTFEVTAEQQPHNP